MRHREKNCVVLRGFDEYRRTKKKLNPSLLFVSKIGMEFAWNIDKDDSYRSSNMNFLRGGKEDDDRIDEGEF